MNRLDQSTPRRNQNKAVRPTPTQPVYRSVSGRQRSHVDPQTETKGRIWKVKTKNRTQLTLFVLGVVVLLLSLLQLKVG